MNSYGTSGAAADGRTTRTAPANPRRHLSIGPSIGTSGALFFVLVSLTTLSLLPPTAARTRRPSREPAHARAAGLASKATAGARGAAGSDDWFGLYFTTGKIGFASVRSRPVKVNGKPATQVDSQTLMQIKLLGAEVSQEVSQIDLFGRDGAPLSSDFITRSNGHANHVLATFSPHAVNCVIGEGAERSTRSIPIPAGVRLGSGDNYTVSPSHLKKGATWSEDYFDPATLAIERFTATVAGQVSVQVGSSTRRAWQVDGHSVMGTLKLYVAPDGNVVRMEMPLGIFMVKEPRETARNAADYHPTADLAEVGSVKSTVAIANPRDVSHLDLRLRGVPPDVSIPSGDGQVAEPLGAGSWRVRIDRTTFPGGAVKIPESGPVGALESTPELNARSQPIVAMARSILAGEQDGQKAVILLHDWVNLHMRARYDIGVLRTGLDVLNDRSGVCRDYAVLYTSLARAAGIPTRVCSGLVYWKGRFYYHAWAESLVGRWVRVDATLPVQLVDATHITLARGDARSMYHVAALVGTIKMEVLNVRSEAGSGARS